MKRNQKRQGRGNNKLWEIRRQVFWLHTGQTIRIVHLSKLHAAPSISPYAVIPTMMTKNARKQRAVKPLYLLVTFLVAVCLLVFFTQLRGLRRLKVKPSFSQINNVEPYLPMETVLTKDAPPLTTPIPTFPTPPIIHVPDRNTSDALKHRRPTTYVHNMPLPFSPPPSNVAPEHLLSRIWSFGEQMLKEDILKHSAYALQYGLRVYGPFNNNDEYIRGLYGHNVHHSWLQGNRFVHHWTTGAYITCENDCYAKGKVTVWNNSHIENDHCPTVPPLILLPYHGDTIFHVFATAIFPLFTAQQLYGLNLSHFALVMDEGSVPIKSRRHPIWIYWWQKLGIRLYSDTDSFFQSPDPVVKTGQRCARSPEILDLRQVSWFFFCDPLQVPTILPMLWTFGDFLRSTLTLPRPKTTSVSSPRITIVQRHPINAGRYWMNAEEFKMRLEKKFPTVTLTTFRHRAADQAQLIAETDIFIAVHGAALTWLFMLPPHSAVVELQPWCCPSNCYLTMTLGTSRIYARYQAKQEECFTPVTEHVQECTWRYEGRNCRLSIELDKLEKLLSHVVDKWRERNIQALTKPQIYPWDESALCACDSCGMFGNYSLYTSTCVCDVNHQGMECEKEKPKPDTSV
eukprot:g49184.t1